MLVTFWFYIRHGIRRKISCHFLPPGVNSTDQFVLSTNALACSVSTTFLLIFLLHVLGYSFGIKHHILAEFGYILLQLKRITNNLHINDSTLEPKCW
jgi:hypothetical protein